MHNKFFGFLLASILVFCTMYAQNYTTNSPYSRFGIGELTDNVFAKNQSMGGTSIAIRDAFHLNPNNPASYSAFDSTEYGAPFIFEMGMTNKTALLSTSENTYTDNISSLSYLSFGFPFWKNRWYGSFGLKPYSNVGYKILSTEQNQNYGNVEYYYYGTGGINKVYSGHSVKIGKLISVGVNANYLFGFLKQTNTLTFTDTIDAFNYQIEKNTRISDLYFNFGIQIHKTFYSDINNKSESDFHIFNIGLIFDNKTSIAAKRDILAGTIQGYNNETINYNNIIDTLKNETDIKGDIILPVNIGLGLSYCFNNKFTIGVDYSTRNWSETTFFDINDSLANSNRTSLGLEFTPDGRNIQKGFSNFLKRVNYRFGAHYSNTYLQFISKNEQIKEFGISFGFGIPVKRGKSKLNLFFELKQRGTTDKELIKEQYGIVGINFTLYDIWFFKRKYD